MGRQTCEIARAEELVRCRSGRRGQHPPHLSRHLDVLVRLDHQRRDASVGRVDQLSRGIYEAMTCTFAGLAVAIVVTIFYYFFAGRIERIVGEMNETLGQFADVYGYAPPRPLAPRPSAAPVVAAA